MAKKSTMLASNGMWITFEGNWLLVLCYGNKVIYKHFMFNSFRFVVLTIYGGMEL